MSKSNLTTKVAAETPADLAKSADLAFAQELAKRLTGLFDQPNWGDDEARRAIKGLILNDEKEFLALVTQLADPQECNNLSICSQLDHHGNRKFLVVSG